MNKIIYTFRTFPWRHELNSPFILSKLKIDLEKLNEDIKFRNPEIVVGLAKSRKNYSTIECVAVNKFNNFLINKTGKDYYKLDIPPGLNLTINKDYTKQFCNYAMYKVAESILNNKLSAKHYFIHLAEKDLNQFIDYLKKYNYSH